MNQSAPLLNPVRKYIKWRYLLLFILLLWVLFWGFLLWVAPSLIKDAAVQWAGRIGYQLTIQEINIQPWSMSLQLNHVALADLKHQPLFKAKAVYLELTPRALLVNHWRGALLALDDPQWVLQRQKDGQWNWGKWVLAATGSPKTPAPTKMSIPTLVLDTLRITRGQVVLIDQLIGERRYDIEAINLTVHDLTTLPIQGDTTLSARLGHDTVLKWRGNIRLMPFFSAGRVSLVNLPLSHVWPYLTNTVRLAAPEGRFSFDLNYVFELTGTTPHLTLSSLFAKLQDINLASPGQQQHLRLKSGLFDGGMVDLQKRLIFFQRIRLQDGSLDAKRDKQGQIDWLTALSPTQAHPHPAGSQAAADWNVQINDLRLENWQLDGVDAYRPTPLSLSTQLPVLSLQLQGDTRGKITLSSGHLQLNNIQLASPGQRPLLTLQQGQISGLSYANDSLHWGQWALSGLNLTFERHANGQTNWAMLKGYTATATPEQAKKATHTAFKWPMPQVSLNQSQLRFLDHTTKNPVDVRLNQVDVSLTPQDDGQLQAKFDAVLDQGSLTTRALWNPASQQLNGKIEAHAVALSPLAPYLLAQTPLKLASGDLSLKLDVAVNQSRWGLSGQGSLTDLSLRAPTQHTPLLAFKRLQLMDLNVQGNPIKLNVRKLALDNPRVQLTLDKNRVSNFQRFIAKRRKQAPAQAKGALADKTPFTFHLRTLQVKNGLIDFSDQAMQPAFSARLSQLNGQVTGLSSPAGQHGTLLLSGKVGNTGEVRVKGTLFPLAFTENSKLSFLFRNIPLASLSTYSERLAGWQIDDGFLSVDLNYQLKQQKIVGNNQIVIESIKLGRKLNQTDITELPLGLAVAILEDSHGRIDLNIPISGDLKDPTFSYGHLLWQAFGNLIGRAVTSPFRALGAMLGIQAFDEVRYLPGEAAINAPEQEKLEALQTMLTQRPNLKLVIKGTYDPAIDQAALARVRVNRAILQAAGIVLQPDEPLPLIDMDESQIKEAVKTLYGRKIGQLKLIGHLLSPGSADFYTQLHDEMIAAEQVDHADLIALANQRADTAAQFLQQAQRIHIGQPRTVKGSADGIPLAISLQ